MIIALRNNLPKFVALCLLALISSCAVTEKEEPINYGKIQRQTVEREFRAAWVATVANINWPTAPGLPAEQQQAEAVALLDLLVKNNMNAVVLQVRPQADALYQSNYEPWSYFLTGEQGKAPEPFYDPLKFWIDEAHKRGIKLHAWINPYRAHHLQGGKISDQSVIKKHPEMIVKLANGYYWFEPTHPKTIDYTIDVVMDIVRNYDVDGIHFDDYFYPYPSYNEGKEFPDAPRYLEYIKSGGELTQNDWRRDAVNRFVRKLYVSIKKEKRHVQFGVSPFGIWRPNQPETIQGFDQYDQIYADAKLWLNEGWVDYFAPQLYWKTNQQPQSYPLLLNWWQQENTENRHLWPGMNINIANNAAGIDESVNQIMINRAMLGKSPGMIFWSMNGLTENPDFNTVLSESIFANQALVPASPWLDPVVPLSPEVSFKDVIKSVEVHWKHAERHDVDQWLVYYRYQKDWRYRILTKDKMSLTLPAFIASGVNRENVNLLKEVSVIAIDRSGNESERENTNVPPAVVRKALFNK